MKKSLPKTLQKKSTVSPKSSSAAAETLSPRTHVTWHQLKLGSAVLDVEPIAVALARTGMPGLIRASAESGRAFLIRNEKNASAATALLINPAVLERRLMSARARRTLGELIDALPFKRRSAPRLKVRLPDDIAPTLRVPNRERSKGNHTQASERPKRPGQLRGPEAKVGT
jgi:hypothetical protein